VSFQLFVTVLLTRIQESGQYSGRLAHAIKSVDTGPVSLPQGTVQGFLITFRPLAA